MVGFWGGKEEGSSIAQRDESRSGLVTSLDFNYYCNMVQRYIWDYASECWTRKSSQ